MNSNTSTAGVYTDFQGLMRLKAQAAKQTPEAVQETARQFEAIFVQTMLKAMRDASPGDGMFESDQSDFYRDMYDQQLALHMTKGRGLGIAKMLLSKIGGQPDETKAPPAQDLAMQLQKARVGATATPPQPFITQDSVTPVVTIVSPLPVQPLFRIEAEPVVEGHKDVSDRQDWRPQSPDEFIRDLLPHAVRGAAALGVEPGVLIAQSALETGWGQKLIRHADGRSSFNLFGIKADSSWSGDQVRVETLEFEKGIAHKQRAQFRSYDSIGDAVSGYVNFLQSNPRYKLALELVGNTDAFLHGLKDAGYATDPKYVEKIKAIMGRDAFEQDMTGLTTSRQLADGNG